jgi:hypothetical protein
VTAVACVEGVPFDLERPLHEPLRRAINEARQRIRPTISPLSQTGSSFTVSGIVGTLELRPGVVLEIAPKTKPEQDWVTAALDLLLPATRASIAGDRRGGLARHRQPIDVLAAIYAERLSRALRRDGPLLVMERRSDVRQLLVGKLDVTRWSYTAAWRPQDLPTSFQTLSADNDFTRVMSHVATVLAAASRDPQVRGRLLRMSGELRPGAPPHFALDPAAGRQLLPPQWAAYAGAWDIAVSVLSGKSLLGSHGRRQGVSLAIEAWPLLETLLTRALQQAVRLGRDHGREMRCPPKHGSELIRPTPGSPGKRRGAEPDGRLLEGLSTIATFEAKYSPGDGTDPPRQHVFQTLATAAACGAPLAVLVYPDEFEPVAWETSGFGDRPGKLVSIGLGLFGYRGGKGDRQRGQRLLELVEEFAGGVESPVTPAAG